MNFIHLCKDDRRYKADKSHKIQNFLGGFLRFGCGTMNITTIGSNTERYRTYGGNRA